MTKFISIESNVGVGAAELLEIFKKENTAVKREPLYNWYFDSLLNDFFSNPSRWSFIVATKSLLDKFNFLKLRYFEDTVVLERSIHSDVNVFMRTLLDLNKISFIEYDIYKDLFSLIFNRTPCINLIIYIKLNINYYGTEYIIRGSKIPRIFFETYEKNLENWLNNQNESTVLTFEVTKPIKLFTEFEINTLYTQIKEKIILKLK